MNQLTGTGVSPGVGFGPAFVLDWEPPVPEPGAGHGGDAEAEREIGRAHV